MVCLTAAAIAPGSFTLPSQRVPMHPKPQSITYLIFAIAYKGLALALEQNAIATCPQVSLLKKWEPNSTKKLR